MITVTTKIKIDEVAKKTSTEEILISTKDFSSLDSYKAYLERVKNGLEAIFNVVVDYKMTTDFVEDEFDVLVTVKYGGNISFDEPCEPEKNPTDPKPDKPTDENPDQNLNEGEDVNTPVEGEENETTNM